MYVGPTSWHFDDKTDLYNHSIDYELLSKIISTAKNVDHGELVRNIVIYLHFAFVIHFA